MIYCNITQRTCWTSSTHSPKKVLLLSATKRRLTRTRLRANSCWPCSQHSHSWSENSSNSVSVRASRSLSGNFRGMFPGVSTRDENPLKLTGRGSGSFIGNGSPRASRGVTLCGEGLSANTFYRRVSEYEAEHGIAEPTSTWNIAMRFVHKAHNYLMFLYNLPML